MTLRLKLSPPTAYPAREHSPASRRYRASTCALVGYRIGEAKGNAISAARAATQGAFGVLRASLDATVTALRSAFDQLKGDGVRLVPLEVAMYSASGMQRIGSVTTERLSDLVEEIDVARMALYKHCSPEET